MRTLTSTGLRRLRHARTELPWILAWAGTLAGIELLGRRASSDVGDALAVAVFSSLVLMTWIRHAARPLGFVARLGGLARRLLARLAPLRIRLGLDLRGEPPLPRRLPPVLALPFAAVWIGCLIAFALREELPGGARAFLTRSSFALYVVLLTALWSVLAAGTLIGFSIPLLYLDERMKRREDERHGPGAREHALVWGGLGYLVALVALASLLPPFVPLALCVAAQTVFLGLSLLPRGAPLAMVWTRKDPPSPPAAFRWSTLNTTLQLSSLGALLLLVLLSRGDVLAAERVTETPLTSFLGLALSWSFVGAYLLELSLLSTVLTGGWRRNPARPAPPRVRLAGPATPGDRGRARAALAAGGFALARRSSCRSTDVPVALARDGAPPQESSAWPRRLSLEELADPSVCATLRRRSEHLCRRALRKGLQRIFKAAARRTFHKGSGFWVAPHHWFVTHLTRDVDEDVLGHIGPSYAREIPLAARRHLHEVLGALEVDLLFVEDGVRFPALRRVLAMIFEHYDIFGSARLADERHFTGLPGVRVILHEFALDAPWESKTYPEPEYEDLGRARILHVFRDRGEDSEESPTPRDEDWLPAPTTPELVLA